VSAGEDPKSDLARIFAEEATEHIDAMVACLLALEAGKEPEEATELLFRHAHSIKGNAGMVGFEDAGTIAAAIEEVLQRAREAGSLSPDLAEPLLQATDALRRAVAGERGLARGASEVLVGLAAGGGTPSSAAASSGRGAGTGGGPAGPATAPRRRASDGKTGARESASEPSSPAARPADSRTPARSLRVSAEKVDRLLDAVGETVLHSRRLDHMLGASAGALDERVEREVDRNERLLAGLQEAVLELRTVPLSSITGPLPRAVRDIAAAEGKEVELQITGAETQFDRALLEGMSDLLGHLLRNAIAHGIEPPDERERAGKPRRGRLRLHAEPRGGQVAIDVSDDGGGIAASVLAEAARRGASIADVLSQSGFSTASGVSDIAGRGVGLDAVKRQVESVGGSVFIETEPGASTRATLLLPISLSLLRVLIVRRGAQRYGIPLANVSEVIAVERMMMLVEQPSIEVRGECVRLFDLADLLGTSARELPTVPTALLVQAASQRVAIACDHVIGEEETVVKPLRASLTPGVGYLGATILSDGGVMLILDPTDLVRRAPRRSAPVRVAATATQKASESPKVLVVDDQFTVRELQRSILHAAGYRVGVARDGREALEELGSKGDYDMVVTDLQMPEMDGLELLAAIRSDPQRTHLPVVMVTSHASEEDRKRGAEAGADAYIVKSEFDQQALLDTVERLVGAQ
jgi:two-component system, chemotaxis family, sensor kinase CheA